MERIEKLEMMYEGKAKKVYKTSEPGYLIVEYKDDATAFNGEKKGQIAGKSVINNTMTNIIFNVLETKGIPTHFVEQISPTETLVRAVRILPLEVIIRNVAAGSFSKRYGVEEGKPLAKTVLEFSYKNDALGDPLINDDHILALELATVEELDTIRGYAFMINDALKEFFLEKGLRLIDFKIEFGECLVGDDDDEPGDIILADEISPDTCRLWDMETNEKMDKDRFRRDLGNVEETYQAVLERVKGTKTNE